MYAKIKDHPSTRELYSRRLIKKRYYPIRSFNSTSLSRTCR